MWILNSLYNLSWMYINKVYPAQPLVTELAQLQFYVYNARTCNMIYGRATIAMQCYVTITLALLRCSIIAWMIFSRVLIVRPYFCKNIHASGPGQAKKLLCYPSTIWSMDPCQYYTYGMAWLQHNFTNSVAVAVHCWTKRLKQLNWSTGLACKIKIIMNTCRVLTCTCHVVPSKCNFLSLTDRLNWYLRYVL